jgi:hypothetical protein
MLASVPIVMFVVHTYQNPAERNTLDERSSNNTIYEIDERANVHVLHKEESRRGHG